MDLYMIIFASKSLNTYFWMVEKTELHLACKELLKIHSSSHLWRTVIICVLLMVVRILIYLRALFPEDNF